MAVRPNGGMGVVDGGRPAPGRSGDPRATKPTARPSSVTSATDFEVRLSDIGRSHEDPIFPADATRDVRLLSLGRLAGMVSARATA